MATNAVIGALRVNLGLDSAEFQNGLKSASRGLESFARTAKIGMAAFAAAFAAGIGLAIHRVEKMEVASRKLDRALENSGNAANTSAKEIAKWADELERRTGRAADEVMAVGANLASFNFGEEVFFRAIELADDMAAAWGGDLRNNLEGLSRALDDPIAGFAMLRKRGVSLTDAQAKMVKGFMDANDKLGAQKVVLEALEEQVKGVAEAGYGGMTKSLGNLNAALSGFFDGIVKAFSGGGMMTGVVDRITAAIDALTENLGKVAVAAAIAGTGLALAFSPAIVASIWAASVALTKGVLAGLIAIKAAMLANPLTALILGITAAITAAYVFRDEIQKAIGVDVIGIVQDAANYVINSFHAAFEDIKFVWNNFPAIMGAAARGAGNLLIAGVEGAINIAIKAIKELYKTLNPLARLADMAGDGMISKILGTGMLSDGVSLDRLKNDTSALEGALAEHNSKIAEIMASNPIGELGKMFETSMQDATKPIRDLGDNLDEVGGKADKNAKKLAEAYRRIVDGAQDFIRAQQLEIGLIGMSEQAANALRYEFDLVNDARRAGIALTDADRQGFKAIAESMAEVEAQAKRLRESVEGWKSVASTLAQAFTQPLKGFSDLLDRLISQAAQLGQALEKAIGGKFGKLFGAAGAGLGAGYGSQNPLTGALGGALTGFSTGGPIGAAIGGIAGLLGGIFGMAKKRAEEARQAAEQLAETEKQNAASRLEIARAAYQRETQALRDLASAHRAYADSIYKTIDAMRLDASITALNPEQRVQEAQRQFEAALKAGPNGDVAGTLQRFAEESLSYYGATEQYFAILSKAQDQALAAAKASERTASVAERQLSALEKQYGPLLGIETGVKSLASAMRDYQKANQAAIKAVSAVSAQKNAPKSIWQRIGDFFGFASGGYTGGGRSKVRGFVHGEEFVMRAQATRSIGLSALEHMNRTGRVPASAVANSNTTNDNRALQNIASVSANGSNAIVDALRSEIGALRSEISSMRQDQRMAASEAQRGGRQRVA